MATDQDTLELATQSLKLLSELASAAENLAERSKQHGLTPAQRAALRNQAKVANEQAGALLARGTVVLFGGPPSNAAKKIDEAIVGTIKTLEKIQKVKKAIEFVTALVGVAGALLSGDWIAVLKSLDALAKKKTMAEGTA